MQASSLSFYHFSMVSTQHDHEESLYRIQGDEARETGLAEQLGQAMRAEISHPETEDNDHFFYENLPKGKNFNDKWTHYIHILASALKFERLSILHIFQILKAAFPMVEKS